MSRVHVPQPVAESAYLGLGHLLALLGVTGGRHFDAEYDSVDCCIRALLEGIAVGR